MQLLEAIKRGLADYDWADVHSEWNGHKARFRMLVDALVVDGVRKTCSAREAQEIADYLGCTLATPRLLDLRHEQAPVRIWPQTAAYIDQRDMLSSEAERDHSVRIDRAVGTRSGMISPVGKPWVIGHGMKPGRGMLYGWHVPEGQWSSRRHCMTWRGIKVYPSVSGTSQYVIQQPNCHRHLLSYRDYAMMLSSLVWGQCVVNGRAVETADVYTSPEYGGLISESGTPLPMARHPGVPLAEPEPEPASVPHFPNLGAAALYFARHDHAAKVRESLGRNDGPEIRKYLARFGLKAPKHWCASALASWMIRGAGAMGLEAPILGSAGARATEGQFRAAGLWRGKSELDERALQPGNVPIWWRGKGPSDWPGHIGILRGRKGDNMLTIEGNSGPRGDRVAKMTRSLNDPRFLGVGILTGSVVPYQPTANELVEAGRLIELGCDVMRGEDADPLSEIA
jgi:hypothetical protein